MTEEVDGGFYERADPVNRHAETLERDEVSQNRF